MTPTATTTAASTLTGIAAKIAYNCWLNGPITITAIAKNLGRPVPTIRNAILYGEFSDTFKVAYTKDGSKFWGIKPLTRWSV